MGCVRSGDVGQCCLKLFQAFGSCGTISKSCCLGFRDGVLVQVVSLTVLLNVVQLMCAVDVIKPLCFCSLCGNPFWAAAGLFSVQGLNKSESSSVAASFWFPNFPHSAAWWCLQMVAAGVCLGLRGALWCGMCCPSCVDLSESQPAVCQMQCHGSHPEPWTHLWESPAAVGAAGCARCHSGDLQCPGGSRHGGWWFIPLVFVYCFQQGFKPLQVLYHGCGALGPLRSLGLSVRHSLLELKKKLLVPDQKKQKRLEPLLELEKFAPVNRWCWLFKGAQTCVQWSGCCRVL